MAEDITPEVSKGTNFLGVDTKLVGPSSGKTPKSGIRRLVESQNPLSEVKRVQIKGTQGYEQDVMDKSSSSNWKEYLFDRKHIKGVFLDNNMLLWFESNPEVEEYGVTNIVRDKYPDQKPIATFELANRDDAGFDSDLTIFSSSDRQDAHLGPLVDYFGRSFDWRGDVKLEVRFADPTKPFIQTDLQGYLFHH